MPPPKNKAAVWRAVHRQHGKLSSPSISLLTAGIAWPACCSSGMDPAAPMQAVQDGATWLLEELLALSCASSAASRATNWSNTASVMAADNALGSVQTELERSSSTRKLHQSQVSHIHIVGM